MIEWIITHTTTQVSEHEWRLQVGDIPILPIIPKSAHAPFRTSRSEFSVIEFFRHFCRNRPSFVYKILACSSFGMYVCSYSFFIPFFS